MPVFALTDLLVEVLTLWLVWSGVAWLGLAAYRLREHGPDARTAVLVLAALAGWAMVLRLTTGLFGGEELVPLGLVPLLFGGLPLYVVLGSLLVVATGMALVARRSGVALAVCLLVLVLGPGFVLPVLAGDAEQIALLSDPVPVTVAEPISPTPITDDEHPGMVLVPAGPFIMGTLNKAQLRPIVGDPDGDEQPVRTVYLDAFYIDSHEVTNRRFAEFVERTGHVTEAERKGYGQVWGRDGWFQQEDADWRHPIGPGDSIVGLDDHPVVQVTWHDATAFCAWEDKRLPTEAEWEKAARGIDARDYPWGPGFDPAKLNYCDEECTLLAHFADSTANDGWGRTAPVGTYPDGISPYGAYDMVGNVWEWVNDWYDASYYSYAPNVNPPGPEHSAGIGADEHRVVRGGSWTSERDFARATSRSFDPPTWSYFGVGFRCAVDG